MDVKAFSVIVSPFGTAESSAHAEVAAKLAQVRALLADLGAPAIVLTTSGAVAWLTAGLQNRIEAGSTASAMWVVVTPGDALALTTNVEAPRIAAEHDLAGRGLALETVEWFEGDAGLRWQPRASSPAARRRRWRAMGMRASASTRETRSPACASPSCPPSRSASRRSQSMRPRARDDAARLATRRARPRPAGAHRGRTRAQRRVRCLPDRRRRRPRRALPSSARDRRARSAARHGRRRRRARRPACCRHAPRLQRRAARRGARGLARGARRSSRACSAATRVGATYGDVLRACDDGLRRGRPSRRMARALPGRADRLSPARVRDRPEPARQPLVRGSGSQPATPSPGTRASRAAARPRTRS